MVRMELVSNSFLNKGEVFRIVPAREESISMAQLFDLPPDKYDYEICNHSGYKNGKRKVR